MTSLLLDTHAMLWFFWDDPRLSVAAKALIEKPRQPESRQHRHVLGDRHQGWSGQTGPWRIEPFLFLPREILSQQF